MRQLVSHPAALFVLLLVLLAAATAIGVLLLRRILPISSESRGEFNILHGAALTLLALLIGFTLSMAVGRYDQRKNLESEEATAINTEYLRADLIEGPETEKMKALLSRYLDQRLLYYRTRDRQQLTKIEAATVKIEKEMWSITLGMSRDKQDSISTLVTAGMNDVINSKGYSEAAWLNRIPVSAWVLMIVIAVFNTMMQGYRTRTTNSTAIHFVLPLMISLSLALISDIDSPRGGLIRVDPQNLIYLAAALHR